MVGDYYISCLTLPAEEEQPIDVYGQRYLRYLKEYHRLTYTNLLTCGRLNEYLVEIDKQAQERFERLIEGMKQAQGIMNSQRQRNFCCFVFLKVQKLKILHFFY